MGEGWGEGNLKLPHKNIQYAKQLRTHQTEAELKMWQALRAGRLMGFKFRRQVPLDEYIVDFVCFERKLIVEIDGGQHMESAKDVQRDFKLNLMGFSVLRFWNNDVLEHIEGVLFEVAQHLESTPHPNPLPQGARGS